MSYAHFVRFTRTRPGATGTIDPITGEYAPPKDDVLWQGLADVQDPGMRTRWRGGAPVETNDLECYPSVESVAAKLRTGDHALIDWRDGVKDDAVVSETRRLDGRVLLQRGRNAQA